MCGENIEDFCHSFREQQISNMFDIFCHSWQKFLVCGKQQLFAAKKCACVIFPKTTCALLCCETLRWAVCRTLGIFVTNDRKYQTRLIFVVHDTSSVRGKYWGFLSVFLSLQLALVCAGLNTWWPFVHDLAVRWNVQLVASVTCF
jgi:hypothetical protein